MQAIHRHFELPKQLPVEKFIARLNKHENLQIVSQYDVQKTFYDSFDWRLYDAGMVCEYNQLKSGSKLNLINSKTGQLIARADIKEMPVFCHDFSAGIFKTKLKRVLEMRALLPVSSVSLQEYRINILNKDQKTTVRLTIEDYAHLKRRVTLLPVKGYEKPVLRISSLLEDSFNLRPVEQTILKASLKLQGRKPGDYSSKLKIQLDPEMRSDSASKYIFSHLLNNIKINKAGTIEDTDSEFLHDFRVSVRRTRAGLSQIKGVFPEEITARYNEFFAWLGQITGLTRDLDVYLLNLEGYKLKLPLLIREDLNPLFDFIAVKQKKAQRKLAENLKSVQYLSNLSEWDAFLKESLPKRPVETNAGLPIKELADLRIWKVYNRVLKEGNAITDESPAEALHDLRKTCKKLRYLLEFFQCMYPEQQIKSIIKNLKGFQEVLGDFQDYEVQEITLKKFSEEMMVKKVPAQTLLAMGVLVQNLDSLRWVARHDFASRFNSFKQSKNKAVFKLLFAAK